jgi:hypothetical protein
VFESEQGGHGGVCAKFGCGGKGCCERWDGTVLAAAELAQRGDVREYVDCSRNEIDRSFFGLALFMLEEPLAAFGSAGRVSRTLVRARHRLCFELLH